MSTYVTEQGLTIPSLQDLRDRTAADYRSTIDPNIDTDPDSPLGQIADPVLSSIREGFEVAEEAYHAFDPDAATGQALDKVCAITGTTREPAKPSTFRGLRQIQMSLGAAVTVPAGTAFTQAGNPSVRFILDEDVTSTSAGVYPGSATCDKTGPVSCNAGTLTVIATPVFGLFSVTNPTDAKLGTLQDSDPALRIRRERELRQAGSGTVDSIRSDLLAIELPDGSNPVTQCTVFENVSLLPDPITGNPGKSIEAMLFDGTGHDCPDEVIAQTLWDSKPGGIELVGNTSSVAYDGSGQAQIVHFTRPTLKEVLMIIQLEIYPVEYVGDDAAKTAVHLQFLAKVRRGGTIRAHDYVKALLDLEGVLDVTSIQMAFFGDPLGTDEESLILGVREMGTLETYAIYISTVIGNP